ncbi:hypothetical protein [uncultured Tenacibaculum sp.]|uniref:hypothetical protein n=1 Tax=uncultured Tenacibaculum sp. TaxID=174713 RepID=UPI00261F8335|nr:hypothetical protein [uncultured Tenacibaculum sp.]
MKLKLTYLKMCIILCTLFVSTNCFSQSEKETEQASTQINFNQKSIKKLQILGIDYDKIDFNNQNDLLKLNLILQYDKRYRSNQLFAYICTGLSILAIASAITSGNRGGIFNDFSQDIHYIAAAGYAGISIPLWIGRSRYKKERDNLIKLF